VSAATVVVMKLEEGVVEVVEVPLSSRWRRRWLMVGGEVDGSWHAAGPGATAVVEVEVVEMVGCHRRRGGAGGGG
jgi:hypothetical protein